MAKVVANVDDDVKRRASALYEEMGLSLSSAVNMFLKQSIRDGGMPFTPSAGKAHMDAVGRVAGANTTAKTMPRNPETGRIVLPSEWDDPEDDVYDNL